MALTKPRVGKAYVLSAEEGLGNGVGSLPSGTVVTVEGIHDPDEAGVGGAVLFVVPGEPVLVDGVEIPTERRITITPEEFSNAFHSAGGK